MTAIVPADPAPYVVRCIDRNVRDLPDRIEVAQALGLLPYVAQRALRHASPAQPSAHSPISDMSAR